MIATFDSSLVHRISAKTYAGNRSALPPQENCSNSGNCAGDSGTGPDASSRKIWAGSLWSFIHYLYFSDLIVTNANIRVMQHRRYHQLHDTRY
jgi:hypothetical protein